MDQFLAEYYGTDQGGGEQAADDDIEKMAQLTLLTKEAAAEGVDLSEFSDGELLEMADNLYGGGEEVDMEKESAAKFEEADFLGRVMAHSFNQELFDIEKEAGAGQWAKEAPGRAYGAVKGGLGKAWGAIGRAGEEAGQGLHRAPGSRRAMKRQNVTSESYTDAMEALKGSRFSGKVRKADVREYDRLAGIVNRGKASAKGFQKGQETAGKVGRRAAQIGAGVGLAGAAGGAGYGGYRGVKAMQEKKSADSAIEQLVIDRANEHLESAGLIEKEAAGDEFETMVDRAALEMLEANGYEVEWY